MACAILVFGILEMQTDQCDYGIDAEYGDVEADVDLVTRDVVNKSFVGPWLPDQRRPIRTLGEFATGC